MSNPKHTHIQGDLNVSAGLESAQGTGFLYLTEANGGLDVEGETFLDKTSINTSDGLLSVTGTNKVSIVPTAAVEITAGAASYFKTTAGILEIEAQAAALSLTGDSATLVSDVTTVGVTGATGVTVTSTANNIQMNAGTNFDVNASSAVTIDANAASNFTVTGAGTLNLNSTAGDVHITGGSASTTAVQINTSDAAGGVDINCGTGGFDVLATDGKFSIDGQNVASNISLATNANAQDLLISLTGTSDSSIIVSSSGTGADAVKITAGATAGGIDIDAGTSGITADSTGTISLDAAAASNFTTTTGDLTLSSVAGSSLLLGGEAAVDAVTISATDTAGGIDINAGTGGITADTTAGISLDATNTSNFTLTGTDTLTFRNTGGQLLVQSDKAAVDAVRIYAPTSGGGIDIDSGSGGITIDSTNTVSIDAIGAASNFSVNTNAAAQDLTIAVTGATDSSLVLSSTGTSSTDAIIINASAGGIKADAVGRIDINTTDIVDGVFIATATAGVPVTIGTATSLTTISGNLTVSGTTTTVNTETLLVEDNLIIVNSGNGELGADGGMVIRRNQNPGTNITGTGDVILDTPAVAALAFDAGSATPGTLIFKAPASAVDDFYNGWWVKILDGAGINQVRRIKDYVGATKTATLYVTADNTGGFVDGLNLVTAPAEDDTCNLYNCPYIASFYDESADKWTLAFSNIVPDAVPDAGTSVVTIQKYASLDSGSIYIRDNGVPGSSTLNVNTINEATFDVGVTIEGVLINNGLINGVAPDTSEIVALPANANTAVNITGTATNGSFMVLVDRVQAASGAGSYLRLAGGAYAVFAACSSGSGGGINRLVSTRGTTDNERIDCTYTTGQVLQLKYQNNRGVAGTDYFRVKCQRVV